MNVDSVLDDRYARWTTDLYDWGYVLEDPVWPAGTAAIILRARWPPGAPEIVITVHEIWLPGIDPDGLGLTGFVRTTTTSHPLLGGGSVHSTGLSGGANLRRAGVPYDPCQLAGLIEAGPSFIGCSGQ